MTQLHSLRVTIVAALLLAIGFCAMFLLQGELAGKATTGSTAYILNSTALNCTLAAGTGYNLISVPCITAPMSVVEVTNNTEVAAMYQYIPTGTDRWKVYNPNLPYYVVNDLQFLTRRSGYVLIMDAPMSVQIEGAKATFTDVPIVNGWNLVGYPSNETRNMSASIAAISASITRVVAYNKSAEAFISYPGGGLNDTYPGLGYWMNSTAGVTWTVYG